MHIIFLFTYFYFVEKKGGGGSALNIFSIFYTHHRIPNKHMMTTNFDTITNNYEVIMKIVTFCPVTFCSIFTIFEVVTFCL